MNKQSGITDATRDAFISAFFELAQIKNIYSITIREITNLAGYNRTTFYRYFQDVFALIEYAEDEFINDMLDSILPKIDKDKHLDEDFFGIYLEKFKEHHERLAVLLCDQNRAHFIRRIQEQTLLRMNSPIMNTPENRVVMNIYLTGIFTALSNQVQNPDLVTDEQLLDIISRLFKNWYWPEVSQERNLYI